MITIDRKRASTHTRLRFVIIAILLTALVATILSPTSEAKQDNLKAKAESEKTSKAKFGKSKAKFRKAKAEAAKAEESENEETSVEEAKVEETNAAEAKTEETSGENVKVSRSEAKVAKAGTTKATTSDGCARAKAGDVVAEAGCDGNDSGSNNDGGGNNDGGTEETTAPGTTAEETTNDETTGPAEEDADSKKGPIAGGTGKGEDLDVKGDIIGQDDNGNDVVGIDTITIQTENCEITDQDNLTITLSDRGEAFRIRDGDNVDITLGQDGTITAKGRKTLGESFPADQKDNPDKLIIPIPVSEDDTPGGEVNDTFPIISSTGIGGEGCRATQDANAATTPDTTDTGNNAVDQIDRDKPLPDTGGERNVSYTRELTLLMFSVLLGLTGWQIALRARR